MPVHAVSSQDPPVSAGASAANVSTAAEWKTQQQVARHAQEAARAAAEKPAAQVGTGQVGKDAAPAGHGPDIATTLLDDDPARNPRNCLNEAVQTAKPGRDNLVFLDDASPGPTGAGHVVVENVRTGTITDPEALDGSMTSSSLGSYLNGLNSASGGREFTVQAIAGANTVQDILSLPADKRANAIALGAPQLAGIESHPYAIAALPDIYKKPGGQVAEPALVASQTAAPLSATDIATLDNYNSQNGIANGGDAQSWFQLAALNVGGPGNALENTYEEPITALQILSSKSGNASATDVQAALDYVNNNHGVADLLDTGGSNGTPDTKFSQDDASNALKALQGARSDALASYQPYQGLPDAAPKALDAAAALLQANAPILQAADPVHDPGAGGQTGTDGSITSAGLGAAAASNPDLSADLKDAAKTWNNPGLFAQLQSVHNPASTGNAATAFNQPGAEFTGADIGTWLKAAGAKTQTDFEGLLTAAAQRQTTAGDTSILNTATLTSGSPEDKTAALQQLQITKSQFDTGDTAGDYVGALGINPSDKTHVDDQLDTDINNLEADPSVTQFLATQTPVALHQIVSSSQNLTSIVTGAQTSGGEISRLHDDLQQNNAGQIIPTEQALAEFENTESFNDKALGTKTDIAGIVDGDTSPWDAAGNSVKQVVQNAYASDVVNAGALTRQGVSPTEANLDYADDKSVLEAAIDPSVVQADEPQTDANLTRVEVTDAAAGGTVAQAVGAIGLPSAPTDQQITDFFNTNSQQLDPAGNILPSDYVTEFRKYLGGISTGIDLATMINGRVGDPSHVPSAAGQAVAATLLGGEIAARGTGKVGTPAVVQAGLDLGSQLLGLASNSIYTPNKPDTVPSSDVPDVEGENGLPTQEELDTANAQAREPAANQPSTSTEEPNVPSTEGTAGTELPDARPVGGGEYTGGIWINPEDPGQAAPTSGTVSNVNSARLATISDVLGTAAAGLAAGLNFSGFAKARDAGDTAVAVNDIITGVGNTIGAAAGATNIATDGISALPEAALSATADAVSALPGVGATSAAEIADVAASVGVVAGSVAAVAAGVVAVAALGLSISEDVHEARARDKFDDTLFPILKDYGIDFNDGSSYISDGESDGFGHG